MLGITKGFISLFFLGCLVETCTLSATECTPLVMVILYLSCFSYVSNICLCFFAIQSLLSPQMLCITAPLISATLFSPSSSFWSVTHIARKLANLCSSEICEYIVRNVCPSWHYNTLYQLTRGVGGERGGREEDVKMLRNGLGAGKRKKKRELFVAAYLTGYEATQWLWHLAK